MSIRTIKALKIRAQDATIILKELSLSDFNMRLPKDLFGIPEYFTVKRGAIKMWPLSKTPYSIEIAYE